jgi:hypothetical protein
MYLISYFICNSFIISGSLVFVSLDTMSYSHLFSAFVTDRVDSSTLYNFLTAICEKSSPS